MKKIETIDQVKAFFTKLKNDGFVFHPDDDFTEYGGVTEAQGKKLNKRMEECFEVCQEAGEDIYGIAIDICFPMKQEFKIFRDGVTTEGKVTILSREGEPFDREAKMQKYWSLGYQVFDMNDNLINQPITMTTKAIYNQKNHPQKGAIKGMTKEQLLNTKRYVEMAITNWTKSDDYPDRKDFNLNYFNVQLSLINKELKNHQS